MNTKDVAQSLSGLFAELTNGVPESGGFILNAGDAGLHASLARLTADEASQSVAGGATIAAHIQHVRYGLSLMNRWAAEGDNPFADARWGDAWTITAVDAARWDEIRTGLQSETTRWLEQLGTAREAQGIEVTGMIASIAHLAYHIGAIRQISRTARGPKDGTV